MPITFLEPGGDATFNVATTTNGGFWSLIQTPVDVDSIIVHGSHQRSIKHVLSGTPDMWTPAGKLSDAGSRISFYAYFVSFGIISYTIMAPAGLSDGRIIKLKISSTGFLQITDNADNQLGSNSSIQLSTGKWYRISLAFIITDTTHNRFELFVNGQPCLSLTDVTISNTGASKLILGSIDSNSSLDFRTSDIYIDDSSSLTDMGNVWVTAKRPINNGTLNEWTTQIGAGGSSYGAGHTPQINERALDTTNGWSFQDTVKRTEQYSIESKEEGDININGTTILGIMGWVYTKVGVNSTGNIIVGGTATNISVTTTATMFTKLASSSVYPSGNTDIGMDTNTVNQLFSLYECGVIVAFIAGLPLGNLQPHYYLKQGFQ